MLKLAIYYCNYTTLGHANIIFSLVKTLKADFKDEIKIIVIEVGIKETGLFPFAHYSNFYFLPIASYENKNILNNPEKEIRYRFGFLRGILDSFKPDILITEYFPFCQNIGYFEFVYFLEHLKKKFRTKIISSCTYINWTNNTYDLIKKYYDLIFLHLPNDFAYTYRTYLPNEGINALNRIFKEFKNKVFFTGFILGDKKTAGLSKYAVRRELKIRNEKLVLVSRGGRTDNNKLILSSMLAAKRNGNIFFLVSCGPATSLAEWNEYKKLSKGINNLKVVRLIPPLDFNSYLRAADLSINMGGYNTIISLLWLKKKSMIIPVNNTEQQWHAKLLSSFIPCKMILSRNFKINVFENDLTELLDTRMKQKKEIKKQWFFGLETSIQLIKNTA